MVTRIAVAAALVALAAPPAPAVGPAQGLSCGLASSTVFGGPAVLTGELAVSVTYRCIVRVVTATGTREHVASFEAPGPVAVLPPAPVPTGAATGVTVCTQLDWVFGFPGGGVVDAGCRAATFGPLGWTLVPEVLV